MRLLLSGRKIETFDATCCSEAAKVTHVDLSRNCLRRTIAMEIFTNVVKLDLSFNRLLIVPALPPLVRELVLRDNLLETSRIGPSAFGNLRQLEVLDVSNNGIDEIPLLPVSVRTLLMSNNRVVSLQGAPPRLHTLDTSHNPLMSLDGLTRTVRVLLIIGTPVMRSASVAFDLRRLAPKLISINHESISAFLVRHQRHEQTHVDGAAASASRIVPLDPLDDMTALLIRVRTLSAAIVEEDTEHKALRKRRGMLQDSVHALLARSVECEHEIREHTQRLLGAQEALVKLSTVEAPG
jgi:Leucine-rich repeat (LRR) protein